MECLHEFSSIDGVREDVTDIVLNVKALALNLKTSGPKKLILDAKGPGEIKAKMIAPNPDIEILNPDLVICNLDEKTKFHMELTVNTGKGYVPADRNKASNSPLGLIAIDAVFSPVKRVSYNVSNAREGLTLDYDKLTMEVETNGSVTAEDCCCVSQQEFYKINWLCLLTLMNQLQQSKRKKLLNLSLIETCLEELMN